MQFKGLKYRLSRRVVVLPEQYWDKENYLSFGRTCSRVTPGAIRTNLHWKTNSPYEEDFQEPIDGDIGNIGYPVFAKKVKAHGHSLTNLMYGADGKMYLKHEGRCYVRSYKIPDKWRTKSD